MHRGELILGTVGEGNRMQTTVIADAVNVASRIEGLTKGTPYALFLADSTRESLTEPPSWCTAMPGVSWPGPEKLAPRSS